MTHSKYRFLVPNGITFLSLICGTCSILIAASTLNAADAQQKLWIAGILVLASYVLDLFDGAAARTLKAGSEFGLQLDSLVDMVSLGMAPAVLVFMHLIRIADMNPWLIGPFVLCLPMAGAFRLARFNLLPPKKSGNTDSVGLTISTGGATVALAVLADLAVAGDYFPDFVFLPFLSLVSLLMVSTIAFPSVYWLFSRRRTSVVLIVLFGVSLLLTTPFGAGFFWHNAYMGLALARAGYKRIK